MSLKIGRRCKLRCTGQNAEANAAWGSPVLSRHGWMDSVVRPAAGGRGGRQGHCCLHSVQTRRWHKKRRNRQHHPQRAFLPSTWKPPSSRQVCLSSRSLEAPLCIRSLAASMTKTTYNFKPSASKWTTSRQGSASLRISWMW